MTPDQQAALDKCRSGSLLFQHHETGQLLLVPTVCRSWACPYCRHHRYAHVQAQALAGHPTKILVLTLRPMPLLSLQAQVAHIRSSWERLRKRMHRDYGPFSYMSFLELQKNGTPHLHILLRSVYIPQAWLSKNWQDLTRSFRVHISEINHVPHAVAECCKYIAKGYSQLSPDLPHVPLVTMSHDWLPVDWAARPDPPGDWDFKCWLPLSALDLEACCDDLGIQLVPLEPASLAQCLKFNGPPDEVILRRWLQSEDYAYSQLSAFITAEYRRQAGGPADLEPARLQREMDLCRDFPTSVQSL